jgi:hypothetical protein
MKRFLATTIIFFQLIGLSAVGFSRADMASLVGNENASTVRTCGGLMNVVYENTVDSMRTLAEIAGLVHNPVKPQKAPAKPTRDDASTPAIIMQVPKTVSDMRSGHLFVSQPLTTFLPVVTDTGQCVFRCMLLLFTGFFLSLYRRKLSHVQAVNGINHPWVFFPAVFCSTRFVLLANRDFSFYMSSKSM